MGTAGDTMAMMGRGNTLAGDRDRTKVQQKGFRKMKNGKRNVCIAKEELKTETDLARRDCSWH
jgi:hypothetical protein